MDVEGFWRREVTPLIVACCMSRSAGLAWPDAVLLDGNAVCAAGDQASGSTGGREGVP